MADIGVAVLVFGGCGFIGRNLVHYLIENGHASFVRVADKVPPQVAWLNKKHQAVFNDSRVEFKSANLINPASCDLAFEGHSFQYVFNCACETKYGQTDPVYEEGVLRVSINCANSAAQHNVQRYIEFSTGQMWSDQKVAHKEDDDTQPWTTIAQYKRKVEEELKNIPNLNYLIIRPGITYGVGDKTALGSRLVVCGLYRELRESLKVVWGEELGMNTVHVEDLVSGAWHLATSPSVSSCSIYHVTDDGDTSQGPLMTLLAHLFGITLQYLNTFLLSTLCSPSDLLGVCEEANDKHAGPWAAACSRDSVHNTPLSPYLSPEQLLHRHIRMDNSKLKATGFHFRHPTVTEQLIREIINDYIEMNMFPKSLLP